MNITCDIKTHDLEHPHVTRQRLLQKKRVIACLTCLLPYIENQMRVRAM